MIPTIEKAPATYIRLYQAFFVISGFYWAVGGAALILYATAPPSDARTVILWMTIVIYTSGALANAWATRGHHFGWIALLVVTILIPFGA